MTEVDLVAVNGLTIRSIAYSHNGELIAVAADDCIIALRVDENGAIQAEPLRVLRLAREEKTYTYAWKLLFLGCEHALT